MKDEDQRMNDCDIIQPELSAYMDGELTLHQREMVELHLAVCPQCRESLAELKTMAVGVASLPKLEPAPRFLAEVRGKIARGDNPEALTWYDYLFRPFWIKVPLEVAAVVAVTVYAMRFQEQRAVEAAASQQLALAENSGNDQARLTEMEAKSTPPVSAEPVPASEPPPAAAEGEVASAPAVEEPKSSQEEAAKPENEIASAATVAPEPGIGAGEPSESQAKSLISGSRFSVTPAGESKRRIPAPNRGPGVAPAPSAAQVATLARSLGIEPAKVGGVVVVRSRNLNDTRSRAEQLASRCNGKVISASPAAGSTGQIFFVELPREYAASFKLDLEQNAAATLSANAMAEKLAVVATNVSPLSATSTARVVGVLTGGVDTNGLFSGPAQLALANNPRAQAAATTVLEILVLPPPVLAPTNATPPVTTVTP
jgi:Putative zinc-finger